MTARRLVEKLKGRPSGGEAGAGTSFDLLECCFWGPGGEGEGDHVRAQLVENPLCSVLRAP